MKKIRNILLILLFLISYFILGHIFNLYIPCPIHKITGLYCPGCGMTRMILSLFKLDFESAFRYNQLLFILFPFFIFLIINYIYSLIKEKEPIYKKINNKFWYVLIIILLIYGVLRNIFPILAPPN